MMRVTLQQYKDIISKRKPQNKYFAKPTFINEIRFSSKAEGDYYKILLRRCDYKEIQYFLRQVPLHLPGNVRMYIDFMVVDAAGSIQYIDVKGNKPTPAWIIKQRIAHSVFPVRIETITKKEINALKRDYGI